MGDNDDDAPPRSSPPSFRMGLLKRKSGELKLVPTPDRLGCVDVKVFVALGVMLPPKLMVGMLPMGRVKLVGRAGSSTWRKRQLDCLKNTLHAKLTKTHNVFFIRATRVCLHDRFAM